MLLKTWEDLCHLAVGCVGEKAIWKVKMESKMEDSSYLAVSDCFKCFGVSRDPGFSFDYSAEQVVNQTNENLVTLLNKQCIQFNVCGL